MLDHLAVTTFSAAGFQLYGKRFIDSFMAHWDIPLAVFYEGEPPRGYPRLLRFDLDEDQDRAAFIDKWKAPEWNASWKEPNSQSIRFCHKVFAITSPRLPASRWRIWIDADVEWFGPVSPLTLRELCPEDCCLSFLGRQDWAYTEAGFIGYRTEDARVRELLADMRGVYTTGALFDRPRNCWHDAATFDLCRGLSGIPPEEQHNISARVRGRDVWDQTLLGKLGRHNKGLRKVAAYGGVVP